MSVEIDGVNNIIKADTISEVTSANGVAVDSLAIKDGKIQNLMNATLSAADLGTGVHIKIADSGATATAHGDELVIEDGTSGANVGMSILSNANGEGRINFGDSDDNDIGMIRYDHADNKLHLIANNTSVITLTSAEIVMNDGSADQDFRVESNGNTHMLFVDGGNNRVGVGTAPDLGVGLHIRTADSGASNVANADDLIIEGSSVAGISIFTGTSSAGQINFGDSGANERGKLMYDHATDTMLLHAGSEAAFRIKDLKLSSYNEAAPDVEQGGLTLQQGGDDGNILTFKSSDIAHGITNDAETDTYATIGKAQGATGGLQIKVMAEALDSERLVINTNGGGDLITTKSASGGGAIHIGVNNRNGSGTNVTGVNTDGNLLVIRNFTNTQFIFDAEGTFHSNVGTATYDEYDDAQLVRAMDLSTSTKGLIASKFDEFIQYKHEDLADAKIVGRDEDGTPNSMVNWTAMSQLHNGAIWQQYEKTQKLTNAMYELAKAAVGEEKANEILEQNEIKLLN